jgi:tetratricopeptide (TPR) repeat protein
LSTRTSPGWIGARRSDITWQFLLEAMTALDVRKGEAYDRAQDWSGLQDVQLERVVIMKSFVRLPLVPAIVCLLAVPSLGQQGGLTGLGGLDSTGASILQQRQWIVAGKVKTLQGDTVPGAKVVVSPTNVTGEFRTLKTDVQGEFRTDYLMNGDYARNVIVALTVTKKGYLPAHAIVDLGSPSKPWQIPVTLRDTQEDPALLPQAELVTALLPRLKTLGAADGLSVKSGKDFTRGLEMLTRNDADRALSDFAKVVGRDPSCVGCRTLLSLAKLESGDWDGAFNDAVQATKQTLADQSRGRPEPLLLFGVMETWRHEPDKAAGFLADALKFAPNDPLALQELGRTQLLLRNWGAASSYLLKALDAGAGPEARFLRAQALSGGGSFEGANQELSRYLDGRNIKTMPLRVREVWAHIQDQKKVVTAYAKVKPDVSRPIDYLRGKIPELQGLEPATDQKPLEVILRATGKKVAEFFKQFPDTSSLEQIHQERLSRSGKRDSTLDSKFRYLCLASTDPDVVGFDEYRVDAKGGQNTTNGLKEGFMRTAGFTASTFVFHPAYQAESTFRYLGRQKLDGRSTFVIAFAQLPAKARVHGEFKVAGVPTSTFTQGLAWVDCETFEILRLRTDLLAPVPQILLQRETTNIDFAEIRFKGIPEPLWLPQQVTVTVDWHGKHLRNVHHYADYKLYSVESTQKIRAPKVARQSSEDAPAPGPQR